MNPFWFLFIGWAWGTFGLALAQTEAVPRSLRLLANIFWPLTLVYLCFAPDKATEVPR